MSRCPKCFTVLFSQYAPGRALKVVRVGTIDGVKGEKGEYVPCGGLRPDAHLFAEEGGVRHGWIGLGGDGDGDGDGKVKVFEGLGKKEEYWREESLRRWRLFLEGKER